ncbi:MAG: hypothetical protein IPG96_12810 [Proteobacteria bacterium]|nr:hypothetical protein [Pseudomonadota bacterium]
MSGDERRAFESTLGPGSQLAVPVQKMMIPPLVRISAGFPIAILIPNPDPSRDIDGDLYLVVQSPYPQSPFPPRYVAFGGTVEATEAQVDFLVRSCGARDFEGPKKRGPRGKMMTDLRFKAPAEKIPMIGQWLSSGRGPRDTHEREALEEFEEFGLLSEREARELLAANRGMPYRRLGKAVNRVGP